jgi:multidrug resistance efflux pump
MKTDPLPPIPLTPRLRWRLFRERVVPAVMFLSLVGVAIAVWSRFYGTPTLSGVAEGVRTTVASPQAGWLRELKVHPYQLVNQGDPVAIIEPVDVRIPLGLLRAELDLARLRHEPSVADQNAMNYERVRVEFLRLKTEVAAARVNLARADNEVRRDQRLFEQKILSEDLYDLTIKTRDALAAELVAKTNAVTEIEQRLVTLRALGDPQMAAVDERLQKVLARLEATQAGAASNWGPITLVAPISGMVGVINRQPGEYVSDGEPVVGVSALGAQRVVAYLRQPYPIDPEVGMAVRLCTRTEKREQFSTSILHVGAQVEAITNALAIVRQGALMDVGLAVVVGLPAQNRIRPGEIVDLWIER